MTLKLISVGRDRRDIERMMQRSFQVRGPCHVSDVNVGCRVSRQFCQRWDKHGSANHLRLYFLALSLASQDNQWAPGSALLGRVRA